MLGSIFLRSNEEAEVIILNKKIIVDTPKPNDVITSPLEIKGKAIGTWYFEGNFPIKLLDENNNEIAVSFATAKEDLVVESFVPFETIIEFENPITSKGTLILEKDNPSWL